MGKFNMTNDISKHPSQRTSEKGFSLIEVAIALIVIGLFVGSAVATYNVYMVGRRDTDTKARVNTVEAALAKFAAKRGYYPLPANRSIAMGATGFGRSVAAVTTACTTSMATTCTTGGADPVYIGDVPFASLGIHYSNASDMYGRKLTYAVTAALTSGTFDNAGGRIQILNEDGTSRYTGTSKAHYVVFSHGPDGQGAYTLGGNLSSACGAAATNGRDTENCDANATFRNNYDTNAAHIDTYKKIVRFYGTSTAAARAAQFDDWLGHRATQAVGMWALIPGLGELVNTNAGLNVLIGTPTFTCTPAPCVNLPKTRVEVQGTARADGLRTGRICYDNSPSGCVELSAGTYATRPRNVLTISHFAGVTPPPSTGGAYDSGTLGQANGGILCADFRPLRGWQYGDELCSTSAVVNNPSGYGDCNTAVTGKYPTGVDAAGQTICN